MVVDSNEENEHVINSLVNENSTSSRKNTKKNFKIKVKS